MPSEGLLGEFRAGKPPQTDATRDVRLEAPRPAAKAHANQFRLLGSRRLLPLFVTQFLGAFNDNIYKQALLILFTYGSLLAAGADEGIYVNLAAGLLVLPFVLFSATAGTLADKFEKSRLIRLVKLGEIGVAALAGMALFLQSVPLLLTVVFLFGVQSAFFGPLKYAILPQHLRPTELVGGNGMMQMGTFVAILLGTLAGGVLGAWEDTAAAFGAFAERANGLTGAAAEIVSDVDLLLVLPAAMLLVAGAGYAASRRIPVAPSTHEGPVRWNPFVETWGLIRIARERKAVFQSILGISWFWLLGSVNLAQIVVLVPEFLAGGATVVTFILFWFTIAIAIGALLCEALSGKRVEIGLVPLGAVGVSAFGIDLYFAIGAVAGEGERSWLEFLRGDGTPRLLFDLGMMGAFASMFVVPLQANIQARTPQDRRARVIAANNVLNAVFMVAGAGFAIGWFQLGGDVPSLLLALAVINIGVAVYIFHQVPEFSMRFLVWLISHSMYRVRHHNLEAIPERGAAIIVCNHVSYVDAPLLAGAVRRPIRFVMHKDIHRIPVLNFIFRTSRTIPIATEKEDAQMFHSAFEAIREGLEAGDLLCVFPEGKLTSDGDVDVFRKGIERIVATTPAPVVPMALDGLWGSFFSREGKGAFRSRFGRKGGRFWSRVHIRAGAPVAAEAVTADGLREQVLALRR